MSTLRTRVRAPEPETIRVSVSFPKPLWGSIEDYTRAYNDINKDRLGGKEAKPAEVLQYILEDHLESDKTFQKWRKSVSN